MTNDSVLDKYRRGNGYPRPDSTITTNDGATVTPVTDDGASVNPRYVKYKNKKVGIFSIVMGVIIAIPLILCLIFGFSTFGRIQIIVMIVGAVMGVLTLVLGILMIVGMKIKVRRKKNS